MPIALMNIFKELQPSGTTWIPPAAEHRIDQLESSDRSWMAWAVPQQLCIVTFHSAEAEMFPLRSWLNVYGWLSHMVLGAATAREVMFALGREASIETDAITRARHHRELIDELDEMYDLDVADVNYRRFYRRLRSLHGLEEQYRNVRERAAFLDDEAEAQRVKADRRQHRIARAAVVLSLIYPVVTLATAGKKKQGFLLPYVHILSLRGHPFALNGESEWAWIIVLVIVSAIAGGVLPMAREVCRRFKSRLEERVYSR